ncbi:MAG: DUF2179 domain-containing protein [Sulfurospirillaceae bacterium]|nr:DUF2179 domain-containing protein [Sulfurospirillaceae bacterium]
MFENIIHSHTFIVYGIPVLICLARITDVSIGTLRIIFVSKGLKFIAPILGFFEISIWLAAISQVMAHLDSPANFIAYALGFSLGNYIGMYIENKLAIGLVVVRIITKRDAHVLVEKLRELKHNVTVVDAQGNEGDVNIIFTAVKRSKTKKIIPIIQHHNPQAVYSIEDIRYISDPNFPIKTPRSAKKFSQLLRPVRK